MTVIDGDEGRRLLEIILRNTEKMGLLIDDLLAFSRLTRRDIDNELIDMRALAQQAFDEVCTHEPGRSIAFNLENIPPARGERLLIEQVWVNLLGNAVKYTRPRELPTVIVTATDEGDEVHYSVQDNGVGFDARYADKLFGVFQRLHGSQEFEGTGIGLALVAKIVQRHNGRVWADAELDRGAVFTFSLPKEPPSV